MFRRRLESEFSFAPGFSGQVLVVAFTLESDAQHFADVMCDETTRRSAKATLQHSVTTAATIG